MKRILAALLALAASVAFGATTLPIQLINPVGSTSGQAIVSTGPSSAPGWTSVAAASGATFTGATGVSYAASPTFFLNDSTGTGQSIFLFRNAGVNEWSLYNTSTASNVFTLGRYVAGTFTDNPISVSNATGVVTMTDGIANSPISGSTGSFTTLASSGNDALFYQNSTAQSISTATATTVTNWTKVSDRVNANFNAATGVFTAPSTGFYQVSAQLFWASAANVVGTAAEASIVANGVTVATGGVVEATTATVTTISSVSAVVSLTAGQTIVLQGFQNSGASRALGAAGTLSFLSITRIP